MYRQQVINLIAFARATLRSQPGGRINIDAFRSLNNICQQLYQVVPTDVMDERCDVLNRMVRQLYGRELDAGSVTDLVALISLWLDEVETQVSQLADGYQPPNVGC